MPRLRLYDCINSRLPSLLGRCAGDVAAIAQYVNAAQRRLLMCREAGDEGWWGTWAEIAFTVSRCEPVVMAPREVARLEMIDVCGRPVPIQNQFYEYLAFGNGRMGGARRRKLGCSPTQAYTRNDAILWSPLVTPPKIIRVYPGSLADVQSGARAFVGGLDSNGTVVYTQDGTNIVQGAFVTLASPFVDFPMQFNEITGVQKDPTTAPVQFFQVDPATGAQSSILTMQPGELVAGYRRYYLDNLPYSCCPQPRGNPCVPPFPGPQPLQVTALAKLQLIPVAVDTDYLLFQNLEAVIEECCSVRYSEMDESSAKELAQEKHIQAIRYLQGELTHYLGKDLPAVNFAPFGDARLERLNIAMI